MTYLEQFRIDHPKRLEYKDGEIDYTFGCPYHYEYEEYSECCPDKSTCEQCWNREMPGTTFKDAFDEINKNVIHEIQKEEIKMEVTRKTKKELLEEIAELKKEIERVDQRKQFEDGASALRMQYDSLIDAGFDAADAMTILITLIQAAGGNRQ